MKIAFATSGHSLEAPLEGQFGRAPRFLIYDLEAEDFFMVDNPHSALAGPEPGAQTAQTVARAGACCLVTGPCDPSVCNTLCPLGIKHYNTEAPSVSEALAQYRTGDLAASISKVWWG